VDATELHHVHDVIDAAAARIDDLAQDAEGRMLAARVVIVGRTSTHGALATRLPLVTNELRAHAIERGDIYLERVRLRTAGRMTTEALAERRDALADLFRSLREMRHDEAALEALRQEVLHPLSGLASELARDEDLDFVDILDEAEQLLEGRLFAGSDEGE
jgi:hypothetical protein